VVLSAVRLLVLSHELELAKKAATVKLKRDASSRLEGFLSTNQTTHQGYLDKMSLRTPRTWRKRYFALFEGGQMGYFEDDKMKSAPKHMFAICEDTVVLGADGKKFSL
jgi:hypothetical protein